MEEAIPLRDGLTVAIDPWQPPRRWQHHVLRAVVLATCVGGFVVLDDVVGWAMVPSVVVAFAAALVVDDVGGRFAPPLEHPDVFLESKRIELLNDLLARRAPQYSGTRSALVAGYVSPEQRQEIVDALKAELSERQASGRSADTRRDVEQLACLELLLEDFAGVTPTSGR